MPLQQAPAFSCKESHMRSHVLPCQTCPRLPLHTRHVSTILLNVTVHRVVGTLYFSFDVSDAAITYPSDSSNQSQRTITTNNLQCNIPFNMTPSANAAPSLPTGYVTIREILDGKVTLRNTVNVVGVVTDFRVPIPTRRAGKISSSVTDPCYFSNRSRLEMPATPY